MRGTARAYFTSGYDREAQVFYGDLWTIDLSPLFSQTASLVLEGGAPPTSGPITTTPATEPSTSGAVTLGSASWCILGGALILTLVG